MSETQDQPNASASPDSAVEASVSEDQAAALAALESGAALAPDAAVPGQPATVPVDTKAEAELAVTMLAEGLHMRWPCLTYDDATRKSISDKLAPVMSKYGLNSDFFAKYGAEINLATTIAVIGFKSYQLVKAEAAKPKQEQPIEWKPKTDA